jgi:hypothetical protein
MLVYKVGVCHVGFFFIFYLNIWGWSPYWVCSALRPLLAYYICPGWLWGWRSWWNERFWKGKPKYSEKTCPDATLSTTNPTCKIRARTRAAAMGNQRLTAWAMARLNRALRRITGFSNFVRHPIFYKLENTAFRKLDLFLSSGDAGRHLLSLVP